MPFTTFAQSEVWHFKPGRKDNQIMAATISPAQDAYKAIQQHLIENNYNIEKSDKETLYITATAPLSKGIGSGQYRLNIFIKEEDSTRVFIQGTYDATVNAAFAGPGMAFSGVIEYTPAKKSTIGAAFGAMVSAGQAVPNAKVRYRRKP